MNKFYYEIHVTGRNSFSTSVVSEVELDDSDVIMLAYEQDKLEGDDCHYIDYIEPLSFEEWDTHFNFDKNIKCDCCGTYNTVSNILEYDDGDKLCIDCSGD